ncbi:unnamed protein product, partial [Musa textilis]
MSSMGSLWPLVLDLLATLMEESFIDRHQGLGYVVALKVKAPLIGSFVPLHTLIDLV